MANAYTCGMCGLQHHRQDCSTTNGTCALVRVHLFGIWILTEIFEVLLKINTALGITIKGDFNFQDIDWRINATNNAQAQIVLDSATKELLDAAGYFTKEVLNQELMLHYA